MIIKRWASSWVSRTHCIAKYIRRYNCQRVLDIGSGKGGLAQYISKDVQLWGLDIKPLQHERYHFIRCDLNNLFPLQSNFFDCAVANAILEHLPDFTNVLKETYRVLTLDGLFIIAVPNPHALGRFVCDFHGGFLNAGRSSKGEWRTREDHMSLFGIRPLGEAHFHYGMMHEWCYVLREYGFETIHTEGCGYIKFPKRLADTSIIVCRKCSRQKEAI